ncbi:MAG TPA: ATP-binding protein [Bdellovibrionota bacterium]|jgi:magnesium chelatase family protein|nr:ATP-binding protein [Bdellovibrionota bacterium]
MNMISIKSAQIHGLEQKEIRIEGIKTRGLKQLHLTGLADTGLRDSREKIAQVIQDFVPWSPVERLLIHLMPPEVNKSGAHLEVPIAVACMVLCHPDLLSEATQQVLREHVFVGALSLDGSLVPTPISSMVEAANENAIGPQRMRHLEDLWLWLLNPETLPTRSDAASPPPETLTPTPLVKERQWERLLLLAASLAEVPVLLMGPPGVGKSHLARWAASTKVPAPPGTELEELQQIWSLAGMSLPSRNPLVTPQPRAHLSEFTGTASLGATRPGYFSLSHRGTLLVDEFTELSKDCREILRFILDEKTFMRFSRAGNVVWPANFWFIATSNPCPCGYSIGEDFSKCRCSETVRLAYRNRLSGPIWDRLGLKLFVDKRSGATLPLSAQVAQRLDAPAPLLHQHLLECREPYAERLTRDRESLATHSIFAETSPRNRELKTRVWCALQVLEPSHGAEEWLGMLALMQSSEDGWRR